MAYTSSLVPPFWLLVLVLISIYMMRRIVIYARLRHFPGPLWASLSNWPYTRQVARHEEHAWVAKLNATHGLLARAGPNLLVTSSPELWQHVNNKPGYRRADWYYHAARVEYGRDNVFTETDNGIHGARRRHIAPGYSGRDNEQLEEAVDEHVGQLVSLIRTRYLSTAEGVKPLNLGQKLQYTTFDIIGHVGLGAHFDLLATDSDPYEFVRSSEEGLLDASKAYAYGYWRLASLPYVGRFMMPSTSDTKGFGRLTATVYARVDERWNDPDGKPADMVKSWMRHGLSRDELRSEAIEQVVAGSETTSTALRAAMLHLATNARVAAALRREIDLAVAEGRAPSHGVISLAQTRKLPYLQAVMREVLRIWPPATNMFPRVVPPGGDTVQVAGTSHYLPAGTCVGYSAWAMHHSTDNYGPDAAIFRPERWFEPDESRLAAMVRINELVFGHGRFSCLGKSLAKIELPKIIFELMRHFDIALLRPTAPDVWKYRNCIGVFVIDSLWVQVTERTPLPLELEEKAAEMHKTGHVSDMLAS
ncbi:hypothetical protein CDD81_638 [Ophiocordyceps australis]|uniref:Uncharacterized protein n=1 Tax=Ophiocordyceps australis TaxID=1399860 RepID=A0A2C5Y1G9_9HYPO|nr:hypothetical protein CDD81_638 [Ophiocordyceps australis]